MNHLILLAAGSSRRFGGNKLLAPLNGNPLYTWGLSALNEVCRTRGDCTLTVVSRYPEIRDAAQAVGAQAVDSPDSEKGQAYSIRAGLQALGRVGERDFILFLPADRPGSHPKPFPACWMLPVRIPGRPLPPLGSVWARPPCFPPSCSRT